MMDANSVMLGKYSLPFILSIILGLIFKRADTIPNDIKPYIAMAVGCVLGIAAMFYNEAYGAIAFPMVADYVLAGGMAGSAAVGIYEASKAVPSSTVYYAIDSGGRRIADAKVMKVNRSKKVIS